MNEIKVLCPATVANLVCGFDILGVALNTPFDILTIRKCDDAGIKITHKDHFHLPTEPGNNVAGVALAEMLNEAGYSGGLHLEMDKRIKPGSGIGSSAASAAGAVVAANKLLGLGYSKDDLVRFAMAGEKLASGVKHADNIAPCIYGGITLIRSIFPLDIVQIEPPQLFVTVVHPQIEVKTSDARNILKQKVALKDAIKQWGNIAGLVAGLLGKDYDLIARSMEDVIIEPVRSILLPGFDRLKKQCREAGALGGGISGSGPSIFMWSKDFSTAKNIEMIMTEIYCGLGIDFHTYVTTINMEGVRELAVHNEYTG